jgi:SAM-dependent methyltransferase
MRIPDDVVSKYGFTDTDAYLLIHLFDEPEGSKILEVGAHDEAVSNMLADSGFKVTGVDLREYNPLQDTIENKTANKPPCNYTYLRSDFCNLPKDFLVQNWGTFDSVICLSAIEHFGLGAYAEGAIHRFYDVIAARQMWHLLKDGGSAYISVPYAGKFKICWPHWRVYDNEAATHRLIQDFSFEYGTLMACSRLEIGGKVFNSGDAVTQADADLTDGTSPDITLFMRLRKTPVNRISPDGR